MTSSQNYGLGTLIVIGALVVGYCVYRLVPEKHFPLVAGVLSADAVIAGLALWGIGVAGDILIWFVVVTAVLSWAVIVQQHGTE